MRLLGYNKRLKFLFNSRIGGAWGSEPEEGNSVICIRAADFDSQRIRPKEIDLTRRSYTVEEIEKKKLKKGDLIIEKSGGGEHQPVGRIALFGLDELALCSNFLEILRPNPAIVDSTFCAYLLYSFWLNKATIPSIKQTTGIQNLDIEEYLDLKANIPVIQQQKSIAAYLDQETARIDALIAAKERLLTLLVEKRQALITRAVTRGLDPDVQMKDSGVEWLGEVPEGWEVVKIKHLVHITGGGTPSKNNPEFWKGNIPWVSPKDMKSIFITDAEDSISEDAIQESATKLIQPNSLLIVVRSGILRHTIPVGKNLVSVAINQDMKALSPIKGNISIDYLLMLIIGCQTYFLAEWVKQGTTVESIEIEFFQNTLLPVPSIIEQERIILFLNEKVHSLDRLHTSTEKSISLLKERRAALISAAVTGQIEINNYES